MSKHLLVYQLLLIVFTFSSCRESTSGDQINTDDTSIQLTGTAAVANDYFQDIFTVDTPRLFRAVALDLPQEEVKAIEKFYDLALDDEKSGYLQYETDLESDTVGGIDYAEVKYIFDDADRLDIVTVNYYIQDSSVTNALFDQLNVQFNDAYGDYYIDSDGYTVWESSYSRNDSIEVVFDVGIRKYIKLNYPGITVEIMRFGTM